MAKVIIYFYYGEDSFTLNEEIKKLKDKFAAKYSAVGVEEVAVDKTDADRELAFRLKEIFESQGLFASSKLVIIWNFLNAVTKLSASEEFLAEAFTKMPPHVNLVFAETGGFDKRLKFFKKLQKATVAKEFAMPAGAELAAWVKNFVSGKGYKIESDALKVFLDLMGEAKEEVLYDLWQVTNELEKLMLLVFESKLITKKNVLDGVSRNVNQNVFSITNLAAEGKTGQAVGFMENMLGRGKGADMKAQSIQVVGALASQIRSLILVKDLEGQPQGKIAEVLGWKEGRVWINGQLAKKFAKTKLVQLLRDLKQIDLRLKTSEEPPKLLLTLFFQKMKP